MILLSGDRHTRFLPYRASALNPHKKRKVFFWIKIKKTCNESKWNSRGFLVLLINVLVSECQLARAANCATSLLGFCDEILGSACRSKCSSITHSYSARAQPQFPVSIPIHNQITNTNKLTYRLILYYSKKKFSTHWKQCHLARKNEWQRSQVYCHSSIDRWIS